MRGIYRRSIALAALPIALALDTAIGLIPRSSPPRQSDVEAIAARSIKVDVTTPYVARAFDFLATTAGRASIVALGESLHVTAEFPLARVRFVQFLHERLGFDVLALEGSGTQAWLAQEYLYRTPPEVADRINLAQQMAWFKLWNTVLPRNSP
jgi:erythromycin esterase-like protein